MLTCNSTPRTFSGKVRKLKQHRRASASRLRPPDPPPSSPMVRATPGQTEPQQAESTQHTPGHAQQDVHAQHAQQMSRMMPEQLQQQPGLDNPHAHHTPVVVQRPGFDLHQQSQQQLQGQFAEMPYQREQLEQGYSRHMPQSQKCQQDMQLQAQVRRQLPDQMPAQQLQQQSSVVRGSRRHRPAVDAAGLACFGRAVQDTEAGRMPQSGPLQSGLLQEPSGAAAGPVPDVFEVVVLFFAATYSMITALYMCWNIVMSPMLSHASSPEDHHAHSHSLGICFQGCVRSLTGKSIHGKNKPGKGCLMLCKDCTVSCSDQINSLSDGLVCPLFDSVKRTINHAGIPCETQGEGNRYPGPSFSFPGQNVPETATWRDQEKKKVAGHLPVSPCSSW